MSKINSTVEVYLNSSEATSALMITGEWGSGKTFYYFNSIEPIILSKKLNPIYISLNGISS